MLEADFFSNLNSFKKLLISYLGQGQNIFDCANEVLV